jgi:hypothetical protein
VAGLYGAIHDQISYNVSPEYYELFKFHQFRIPPDLRNRVGASIVGWQASWWMGLIVGVPVMLVGLIIPGWKGYLTRCLEAILVVVSTTLAVGLGALAYASCTITAQTLPDFWYPANLTDPVAFARVGMMHNFGYLGGFLGILTGSVYLVIARLRLAFRKGQGLAASQTVLRCPLL